MSDVFISSEGFAGIAEIRHVAHNFFGGAGLVVLTLRRGLAAAVAAVVARDWAGQECHFETEDFSKGLGAAAEPRFPVFSGRGSAAPARPAE